MGERRLSFRSLKQTLGIVETSKMAFRAGAAPTALTDQSAPTETLLTVPSAPMNRIGTMPPTAGAALPAMGGQTTRLVVMLATYNEASCISESIRRVAAIVPDLISHGIDVRLLVVDDCSPDGTADLAVAAAHRYGLDIEVSSAPRSGLGRAYLRGFAVIVEQGWADTIVTLDADGQHDPALIPTLVWERDRLGVELMVGSRWVEGGQVIGLSGARKAMSRFGNRLFSVVTGTYGVRDATTSYRVFSTELAAQFDPGDLSVSGYSFFSAFVGVAVASGRRVAEHPIVFASRTSGESKLQVRDLVQFAANLPALRRSLQATRRVRLEHLSQQQHRTAVTAP